MAIIKSEIEIEKMRLGGEILSRALQAAIDAVAPGKTLREIDKIGEEAIVKAGAKPSFKGYKTGKGSAFPSTICISVNNEVVHGLGNRDIKLKDGDIVGLDIGCWYEGLCTDMAVTVPVGKISPKRLTLLNITREAMRNGVQAAAIGKEVNDIARAIEESIPKQYGIVKALVGHGVGHAIHESPHVPNFISKSFPRVELKAGMCLAIEPMVTTGSDEVLGLSDGWTIVTADKSDAAHFEVTIALTKNGVQLLTPEPIVPGLR